MYLRFFTYRDPLVDLALDFDCCFHLRLLSLLVEIRYLLCASNAFCRDRSKISYAIVIVLCNYKCYVIEFNSISNSLQMHCNRFFMFKSAKKMSLIHPFQTGNLILYSAKRPKKIEFEKVHSIKQSIRQRNFNEMIKLDKQTE